MQLAPCCESLFEYMLGGDADAPAPPPALSAADYDTMRSTLSSRRCEPGTEAQRVHAAFSLARSCCHAEEGNEQALTVLMDALTEPSHEAGMRAAMHALGCGAVRA
jgi:hypothetical protein